MEIQVKDPRELKKVGGLILEKLKENNLNLLELKGELGSGKTTLTQEIGKQLGVTSRINSPTFVIQRIHKCNSELFDNLYHIDLYRVQNAEELDEIGLFDDLSNKRNLYVLEWPEILKDRFEKKLAVKIKKHPDDKNSRLFVIE